jgi:hypothetical protein
MLCMMWTDAQFSWEDCDGMIHLPSSFPVSARKKYIVRNSIGSVISHCAAVPPPGSWLQIRTLPSHENALVCPIVNVPGTSCW